MGAGVGTREGAPAGVRRSFRGTVRRGVGWGMCGVGRRDTRGSVRRSVRRRFRGTVRRDGPRLAFDANTRVGDVGSSLKNTQRKKCCTEYRQPNHPRTAPCEGFVFAVRTVHSTTLLYVMYMSGRVARARKARSLKTHAWCPSCVCRCRISRLSIQKHIPGRFSFTLFHFVDCVWLQRSSRNRWISCWRGWYSGNTRLALNAVTASW